MTPRLLLGTSALALALGPSLPVAVAAQENGAEQVVAETRSDEDAPVEPSIDLPAAGETIVVQGTRLKGQLIIDQPPIAEFDEEDIAAFGASSIEEIIAAIEPTTSSGARGGRGGGRPVFLINGIRVSGWREFRSYPPEAVAKIEVFPEEVAQRFGYSADQRVVNIILQPNFQSVTAEVEYEQPDRGGYSRTEQELTYLRIGETGRLNFNFEVEDGSLLTEAERGLTVAGAPGEAAFRSLVPDTLSIEATANYARAFIDTGTSLSFNGTYERDEARSLSGLSDDGSVGLERRSETDTYSIGGSANQPFGGWNATYTLDAVRALSRTEIDQRDGTGFDSARSRTWTIANDVLLRGGLLELPAGEVTTSFDLGLDWKQIDSEDTRSASDLSLTRRRLNGGVNLAIPVAERGGAWGAIGDISVNVNAGAEDLSDFGFLTNWSAGVNWSPFDNLNLSVNRIEREVAPSLTNLGSPRVDEFNVPVFDYNSGSTELVTLVTGGNPDLLAEDQSDWKFSANWELPFWDNARLQADYGINRSRNVTSTPGFSAAFEQAFPDRVARGDDGELLAIDRRPITLFQTRSRILSFGFNARGQIGPEPERAPRGGRGTGQAQPRGDTSREAFDPARMEKTRAALCQAPEGEMPDILVIPEPFRARLLDENGNPDPAKIAAARERFCGADAGQRSERFAAMRRAICADPPNFDGLPEEMLARLRGEDGEIDPERLRAVRERICSTGSSQPEPEGRAGGGRQGSGNPFARGDDGDTRPRYFFSLNHNIALQNEVLLSRNGPLFDQLDGEVLSGAAIPENTSRVEGGIFWQGYGLRLSGSYIGEAVIRGDDTLGSSDLFFGDLATFDVRLFADLGEVLEKNEGWLDGLRLSLVADNLFDARRNVMDEDGNTPDAYAPFRIDPTGRYLGIDVRKSF